MSAANYPENSAPFHLRRPRAEPLPGDLHGFQAMVSDEVRAQGDSFDIVPKSKPAEGE